ncbi:MAG: RNA methyltransferase [Chloroflexi bacterium]|nr:RNA methyltransferase [Chloroflexota bacterium]
MIASLQNEKVRQARALAGQRKARERLGQFVIEGAHLLQEAERAGIQPALLFFSEAALQTPDGRRLAARWPRIAETVSDKVLSSLSETVSPQGIVAVVPFPALVLARRELLLVLDGVRDPGNAGTLLRSAAAAGVDAVWFGPGCADLYSPKVVRAAMGAHFRLPARVASGWAELEAAVDGLDVLLADAMGETDYDRWDWHRPAALVVGGEAAGAGAEGRARATHRVRIPMHRDTESLNAAVAGSIILFEAARQRRQTSPAHQ